MKILLALNYDVITGGAETYIDLFCRKMSSQHDIKIIYELEGTGKKIHPQTPRYQSKQSRQWLNDWNPELSFVHRGLVDQELEQYLTSTFPSIFFAHDYSGMCISGHKSFTFPRKKSCHRALDKTCLGLYHILGCGGKNPLTTIKQYQLQSSRKNLLAKYKHIQVASEYMKRELQKNSPNSLVSVTPYPLPMEQEYKSPSFQGRKKLLFMGRLVPQKGAVELVEALATIKDKKSVIISAVICGEGPEYGKVRSLVDKHNLDVTMPGWVDDDQKRVLLSSCNLHVIPSLWPEPFGINGIEAAQAGLPTVAFNTGGISQWLTDGHNGILVNPNEGVLGLARAITQFYQSGNAPKMAANAQQRAGDFSWEPHKVVLDQIIQQVTGL